MISAIVASCVAAWFLSLWFIWIRTGDIRDEIIRELGNRILEQSNRTKGQ